MLSIVIPTFNEEAVIRQTIRRLQSAAANDDVEIIVVDGGSSDATSAVAAQAGALAITSPRKGRSAQMNEGAAIAKGDVLYFLHADSDPPETFVRDISDAVRQGKNAGCFRLRFDMDHWFLRTNAWFTRFDMDAFRFGDQSLFVTQDVFRRVGGFCEKHIVLEDQEIIRRIRRHANFTIIPKYITTSARKYEFNGIYRTQAIFFLIYMMYRLGYSQQSLVKTYRRLIRQDKI